MHQKKASSRRYKSALAQPQEGGQGDGEDYVQPIRPCQMPGIESAAVVGAWLCDWQDQEVQIGEVCGQGEGVQLEEGFLSSEDHSLRKAREAIL